MKYWDIEERKDKLKPFNIFIGARGIGKTYSTLKKVISEKRPFLYLRNTAEQIKNAATPTANPFISLNKDLETNITIEKDKGANTYSIRNEDEVIGQAAGLSTFNNFRGGDLSYIDTVVFDEFIENNPLRYDQFKAFINMYELVNRNRELEGRDPARVYMLSNAQTINNRILDGLNLIDKIAEGYITGQRRFTFPTVYVELCKSEVSNEKAKGVLAQTIEGTALYDEYYGNIFPDMTSTRVKKQNIVEYKPIASIDDRTIYRHKTTGSLYVKRGVIQDVQHYDSIENRLTVILKFCDMFRMATVNDMVFYEHISDSMFISNLFTV